MRLFSFIAVITSFLLVALMYKIYSPLLDDPDTELYVRILCAVSLFLQAYLIFFCIYTAYKSGVIKWEAQKEELKPKMKENS
jgi:hypothetical protein